MSALLTVQANVAATTDVVEPVLIIALPPRKPVIAATVNVMVLALQIALVGNVVLTAVANRAVIVSLLRCAMLPQVCAPQNAFRIVQD